jgi:hypothetical protein
MSETGRTGPPATPEAAGGGELDEATYATLVEEAFIAERGTPFLLSAKDWLLVKDFRERGIPAGTVIRAIHETFEKRKARAQTGKISSIAYCANAVEERWEMERRGLVGQGEGQREGTVEDAGPKLDALERSLVELAWAAPDATLVALVEPSSFAEKLRSAGGKIGALPRDLGVDALEEKLSAIESSLLKSLEKRLTDPARAALEARVSEALGDPSGVGPMVAERLRRALTRREVRRLFGIPPLTLFHV